MEENTEVLINCDGRNFAVVGGSGVLLAAGPI